MKYGMEDFCQYGIWKNRLPFHSIPCPAHKYTQSQNHVQAAHTCQFGLLDETSR